MERHYGFEAQLPQSRGVKAENLLLWLSALIGAALGLVFGLTRFILLIRENLRSEPSSVGATLFLGVMVGGVALLIMLLGAAVGFTIGAILHLGCRHWWGKRVPARP